MGTINKPITYILIFSLVILVYNLLSYKTASFTDAAEYIGVAKAIAGMTNTNVYVLHTITYPVFLSFFLKLFPWLLTLKLVNVKLVTLLFNSSRSGAQINV